MPAESKIDLANKQWAQIQLDMMKTSEIMKDYALDDRLRRELSQLSTCDMSTNPKCNTTEIEIAESFREDAVGGSCRGTWSGVVGFQ